MHDFKTKILKMAGFEQNAPSIKEITLQILRLGV